MKPTKKVILYYKASAEGITILGAKGRASQLHIPETIDGKPVVALGAFAFAIETEQPMAEEESLGEISFCLETEERTAPPPQEEGDALVRIVLPDTICHIGASAFFGCSALRAILLPEGLEEIAPNTFSGCSHLEALTLPEKIKKIGCYAFYDCHTIKTLAIPKKVHTIERYAFYNCRSLTKMNIPKNAEHLETGLFLNCDSLYEIHFGQCKHISDLIAVLNHELLLSIDFPDARVKLLIPDFQYEYIEDTPARMFHQINYGTGHLFRQCIRNADIDFRRYDELFYLTRREDAAVLVLLLAVYRLSYPYRLPIERRETYLSYVREHLLFAVDYYIQHADLEVLRLFAQWGLFTAEVLPKMIDLAQKKGKTEILSFLMDYQHKNAVQTKKKNFDL
ncbi:MAG: leucine-rich repeat domain-containing protein [Anaerotignum sp.]|nr:leucine-rich repeat domain-containing protein [Anaerotignum sp.]